MMCHYQSTPSITAHVLFLCKQRGGWSLGRSEWSIDFLVGIKKRVFFCLFVKLEMDICGLHETLSMLISNTLVVKKYALDFN